MSNLQLTIVAVAALVAHLLALAVAVMHRGHQPAFWLNLLIAAVTLTLLATNLRWLRAPVDLQVAGLALLEILVVTLTALALARGYRAAVAGSWIVFVQHFLTRGVAVLFVFTFKITRLIGGWPSPRSQRSAARCPWASRAGARRP